ncbi:MAG: hypothetical protein IJC48_09020 [Clostridia bacterium]|nr:hypothetical protein [Clostridia bacterium]
MSRKPITYARYFQREKSYRAFRGTITFILILAGVLFLLHAESRLSEYEASQPEKRIAEFAELLKNGDEKALAMLPDDVLLGGENPVTEETYIVNRITEKELTWHEKVQTNPDRIDFDLMADGEKIALIELAKAEKTNASNYDQWEVSKITASVKPAHLASDVLIQLSADDFSSLIAGANEEDFPRDSASALENELKAFALKKRVTLVQLALSEDSSLMYQYRADDTPLATVQIAESGKDDGASWELTVVSFDCLNAASVTIRVPASAKVTADAETLDSSHIVAAGLSHDYAAYVPEDAVNPVDFSEVEYRYTYFYQAPEIKAYAEDGREYTLVETESGKYTYQLISSPELFPDTDERILQATDTIANFLVGLRKLNQVLKYVEKPSAAYDIIDEYDNWRSVQAGSARISDFTINSIVPLGDNCFAADIRANFFVAYSGKNQTEHSIGYTFFFRKVNNQWMIYNLLSR